MGGVMGVMVKEKKIVFGLEDITSIRIQCGKCAGVILLKLVANDMSPNIPPVCPHCQESWQHSGAGKVLAQCLLNELHRELRNTNGPVQFFFELDDD